MIRNFIYIILVIQIISCGQKNRQQEIIESLLKSPEEGRNIDNFNQLYNLASKCPSCLDSLVYQAAVDNGIVDSKALEKLYFNESIDTSKYKIKAKVFLENSASMWGYFKGSTDAEKVISRVLLHSDIRFGDQVTEFAYITDSIYPQKSNLELDDYIRKLEPTEMRVGGFEDTEIADILKTVIYNTGQNELSILFSDCIYSLNTESSTESSKLQWSAIEAAFARLLQKSEFSVLVVKYSSQFNGTYYSLRENGYEKRNFVGGDNEFYRPYYAIVIGETNLLKEALEEIDFNSYVGYENSYFITQPRPSRRIDYRIINAHKIGKFRPDKKNRKTSIVGARKVKGGPQDGLFQYTIAVNLNDIGVENSYVIDNSKYDVTGGYRINVAQISDEDKRTNQNLSSFTHYFHLQTSKKLQEEELFVSLRRETPKWILDTHTDVDNILTTEYQSKTRGFKDLIEGIENAFDFAYKTRNQDENKYYFTILTKVNL